VRGLYGADCLFRPDTFSLGVCNGCQLMALLGWVPGGALGAASAPANGSSSGSSRHQQQQQQPAFLPDERQPRFVHNTSGRFECRWATVRIEPSPSVLLKVRWHL
jgi:phosphoribosylformylglycinamidine synthase